MDFVDIDMFEDISTSHYKVKHKSGFFCQLVSLQVTLLWHCTRCQLRWSLKLVLSRGSLLITVVYKKCITGQYSDQKRPRFSKLVSNGVSQSL